MAKEQSGPVVVEYPDGAVYEVVSAEAAKKVHPDAKIVGYAESPDFSWQGLAWDRVNAAAAAEAKAAAQADAPKGDDKPKGKD